MAPTQRRVEVALKSEQLGPLRNERNTDRQRNCWTTSRGDLGEITGRSFSEGSTDVIEIYLYFSNLFGML